MRCASGSLSSVDTAFAHLSVIVAMVFAGGQSAPSSEEEVSCRMKLDYDLATHPA